MLRFAPPEQRERFRKALAALPYGMYLLANPNPGALQAIADTYVRQQRIEDARKVLVSQPQWTEDKALEHIADELAKAGNFRAAYDGAQTISDPVERGSTMYFILLTLTLKKQ